MAKLADDIYRILRTKHSKDIDKVGKAGIAHNEIREELLEGLSSNDDYYRYNCFRAVQLITAEQPNLVYSAWQRLEKMLESENSYQQNIAAVLLANLTAVDKANKFEKIFARYFELLESEGLILARYVAQGAGKIARHKPKLQSRITEKLLAVEKSRQKQKELIKTDVINSLSEYFEVCNDKEKIMRFVTQQTQSSSPKTQKAAKAFLKKYSAFGKNQ
jgi:hypothetical protein